MIDANKTLYQVLTNPDNNLRLKPGIFVNEYDFNNGILTFNTVGYMTRAFAHFFRIYIPFTSNGTLIPDFNNGVYTVYPQYNIMVIETPSLSDPKSFTLNAVYHMGSNQFEMVYLDDNLEEVPIYKASEAAIKRFMPKSFEPTQDMRDLFNNIQSSNTKLNILTYRRDN